jgi:DNA invertase Pin-like site-specific DNA recombinase
MQRDRLEAYARSQGGELVAMETDNGASGKTHPLQRPGLHRALKMIRRGEASGLLVFKLDRLSRSVRDVLDLADDARRRKWRLVSVSEALDTDSATGRFTLTILSALAELERAQVSERTQAALAQVAREGRMRSGRIPFGYRSSAYPDRTISVAGDRSRLVKHRGEQRVLRRMLKLRAEEEIGPRRIARMLNDEGLTNPRTGRPWSASLVQRVLGHAERRAAALA